MKEFLKKEKQGSVCAFFAMLVAMCLVGSYYLQYSQDFYWVKLFTDLILILCSGYVFAASAFLKEHKEKYAALGLIIVLIFVLLENVFWLIKRAEWRMTAEAISLAFKTFGVFTLLDVITFGKSLIKKWWYILISATLLLLPAILKNLPLIITSLTTSFSEQAVSVITIIFNSFVAIFGLTALIIAIIQIVKKNYTFVAWSSTCYSLSVVLYGVFGVLRQVGVDASQWSKNTSVVFELGVMLLLIAIVNYGNPVKKYSAKKK